MTKRNITDLQQLAAIGNNFQKSAEILSLELGSTVYRFTNGSFDITIGTDVYLALGNWLAFTDVDETSDMSIASITITLSGIDVTTVQQWLTDDYIDKNVMISRVYFSDAWVVVGSPVLLFDGKIDSPVIQDTGTGVTVGCKASSQWVDFNRRNGRWTSQEIQQTYFPTDLGFQYASVSVPNLQWGGESPPPTPAPTTAPGPTPAPTPEPGPGPGGGD